MKETCMGPKILVCMKFILSSYKLLIFISKPTFYNFLLCLDDEYDDANEVYRNNHSKYSKLRENSKNEKKGRLIIRNLSFKVI